MQLYAQDQLLRTRQVVGDAAVTAWVVLWVLVARFLNGLLVELEAPGRLLEDAGGRLARVGGSGSEAVDDLPVVGDRLASPFDAVADGGRSVTDAGLSQQDVVGAIAFWLPVVLALLPIGYVLARYLPGRLRWAREAVAAGSLLEGDPGGRLFALRALATRPLADLRRVAPDPVGAYEAGDPVAVDALAALELGRLGLRPRARAPR